MLKTSDPIRLVGRTVDIYTASGAALTGTLCSAGLGGVIVDVDGVRHELEAGDVERLEARGYDAPVVDAR